MARVSAAAADQNTEPAVEKEHQVLYRKFRPRQFADVVGQDHIIKPLQGMVANRKVGHAFLFVGPRGCGKTTTARLLAMAMNCPNAAENGEPCGECGTCKGIINGSGAIGLHELDAASKRGVADMNSLIDTMGMGSVARKKVYIIDECHMLTNEASNALLKTLEEPPADTLIILCTTEAQKVLPTIKSRAVTYNFKTVNAELMTSLVNEIVEATGMEIDDAGIAEVVRRGNGSPRDTLTALEGFGGEADAATSDFVPKIAGAVADRDATDLVVAIAESINAGIGIPDLTRSLLEHWRNCLLFLQAPSALSISDDALRQVSTDAKLLKTNKVIRLLNVTSEALSKMNSSSDTRLLLETTLLQVALPETAETIDGIYDYLDDIMAEVKRLGKSIKNGVSVQKPSEWPPVADDEVDSPVVAKAPAVAQVEEEPSPAKDEASHDDDVEDEPASNEVESGDQDADETDGDTDDPEGDSEDQGQQDDPESDTDVDDEQPEEDDSAESAYESYDDASGDDEQSDQDSDERDDDHEEGSDLDNEDAEVEAPVRNISALFGDDDDDESDSNDDHDEPAESDRQRESRLRRERGDKASPVADVVPGDFHNDDDPNCDCTRCQDEIAEHEQRAIREERERKEQEAAAAAEAKKPVKLHLVKDDEDEPNAVSESKPARSKKKKLERVWSEDECPSAGDLVDIIQHDIVDKQTGLYLQPEFIKESLRGDVLVITVKPKSRRVPTDDVIDTVRAAAVNLWVSDIEFVV